MNSSTSPIQPRWLVPRRFQPLKIALIYAIVAGLWIVTSDTAVNRFAPDKDTANFIHIMKGWAFVVVTAAMLWLLVHRLLIHVGKSEAGLRQSEEQARAIFHGVNDAIFILNAETGQILDVNESASRMLGYPREDLHHLDIEDLSSGEEPYTQKNAMAVIETALRDRQVIVEWRCRHRDGHLFWVEVNARPAIVGSEMRLLVAVRNIDQRKQALEELRKLSRAVEQSPVSIIITDPAGIMEYVNPATCRLTGYSADELIGKNPRILKSGHLPPEEYRQLWATISQGGEWHGELRNRKKNGDLYWEAASISPITDTAGLITHFLSVKEDITERKLAEQELEESRRQLRALLARIQEAREEERTRIAREIHDVLGQLLTGMNMDLSWLERRLPRIADATLRAEFANQLAGTRELTASMLESVQKISRDLRPSILDNLGLPAALQFEARQFASRTGIACAFDSLPAAADLPADCATHVFRIFQEILTNAARHSGASRVTAALVQNGEKLTLNVADNGCGISPDAMHDPASLGLLGMSERASLIDGTIRIHDTPGGGTTVNLTIPRRSN